MDILTRLMISPKLYIFYIPIWQTDMKHEKKKKKKNITAAGNDDQN